MIIDDADGRVPGRPLRIGLTGPIGCGKSTVARHLASRGALVIDADDVARAVTEPGQPALDAIADRFGQSVLHPDGRLDRAGLGRVVFEDPAALAELEAIIHPAVRPRILAALHAASGSGAPAVVLEAIRLVDAGYADDVDEIWLVECARADQLTRLHDRGLDPDEARKRIEMQEALVERARAIATRIISTDGQLGPTLERVDAAFDAALGRPPISR